MKHSLFGVLFRINGILIQNGFDLVPNFFIFTVELTKNQKEIIKSIERFLEVWSIHIYIF
jgi:hypothetical protein